MLNEKIHIVYDNGDLRRMLRISLGYGKYKMYEAATGAEAIQIAREQHPNVMLLDVMMPGELDGFQVCEMIKNNPDLKNIFVIILTALSSEGDRSEGNRVKADFYMQKPFSPLHLIEIIETRHKAPAQGTGVR